MVFNIDSYILLCLIIRNTNWLISIFKIVCLRFDTIKVIDFNNN